MKNCLAFLLIILCQNNFAQQSIARTEHPATIREYNKFYTTYPFSDPNPIPLLTPVYPYYRFDGFTTTSIQKEWKVVELENDYIKLLILPEIGGKIWTAIEKPTGRPFLYDNHAVKFRDIAMRGPWTSGGLESNFGIIGHTPNCATPVDYITRKNPDGSVSCIIGVLDLLTRSRWNVEINLPSDKALFTTCARWFNQTPLEQPYYHWMNAGLKAAGNLEFIYPGNRYLGHEGEYAEWPIHPQNGKNLSFYEQNNFGSFKSYHVFGTYADFAGAYWHDDNMGMVRYGTHDDKPGKKIWIWGLSRQGMIWEKMLTDQDGQYVELQSGRLFNQNADRSSLTPFKHRSLQPWETDTWTEYWYPVLATQGMVKANEYGALNLRYESPLIKLWFCPVQPIHDTLELRAGDRILLRKPIDLNPLQTWSDSIPFSSGEPGNLTVTITRNKFFYSSTPHIDDLSRPVDAPKNFDWTSVFGLFTAGREAMAMKNYPLAEEKLRAALQKDPNYLPALTRLAELLYRNRRYQEALELAKQALSIDSDDGAANYFYGLINDQLGHQTDARDGFDLAAQDPAFRSAAYTELSRIYLRMGMPEKAITYAGKALDNNRYAIEALQVQALAYRILHDELHAMPVMDSIAGMDALNHFRRYEQYCWHPDQATRSAFTDLIRNELPQETYLELGIWYHRLGRDTEAATLFEWCPAITARTSTPTTQSPSTAQAASPNPEAAYWLAFLGKRPLDPSQLNPNLSFPFRSETGDILEQLLPRYNHWLLKYHLALIDHDRNRLKESLDLLESCQHQPDYAPFYATRAAIRQQTAQSADSVLNDLKTALSLDNQWRYRKLLTQWYLDHQQYPNALSVVEPWYRAHPDQYIMGMLYAKALLFNGRYAQAGQLLKSLNIIPFEGATEGHELYREALLMQALTAMEQKKYTRALSFIKDAGQWPENLGAGRPYDQDIDQRLERWLTWQCLRTTNKNQPDSLLQEIVRYNPAIHNTIANFFGSNALVTAWSLEKLSGPAAASQWLDQQLAKFPDNRLLHWSRDRYEHRPSNLAPADLDSNARILEKWMQQHP